MHGRLPGLERDHSAQPSEAWPDPVGTGRWFPPCQQPVSSRSGDACVISSLCPVHPAGPQTYHLIASQNTKMQGFSCSDISEAMVSLPLDAGWVAVGTWKSWLAPKVTLGKKPASELVVSTSGAQKKPPRDDRAPLASGSRCERGDKG